MLISILKDSLTLFLLIYAILNLGGQLIRFLMRCLCEPNSRPEKFFVLDMTGVSANQLEYVLRSELSACTGPVFLITEQPDAEAAAILGRLCRELPELHPVSRSEFHRITNSPTALAAFLTGESAADQVPCK